MIKCLCKENVQDRITGENYVAGNEYEFTKERAEEVTKSRYFEYAKEKTPKEVVNEIIEKHNEQVKPKKTKKSAKK